MFISVQFLIVSGTHGTFDLVPMKVHSDCLVKRLDESSVSGLKDDVQDLIK